MMLLPTPRASRVMMAVYLSGIVPAEELAGVGIAHTVGHHVLLLSDFRLIQGESASDSLILIISRHFAPFCKLYCLAYGVIACPLLDSGGVKSWRLGFKSKEPQGCSLWLSWIASERFLFAKDLA